MRVWIGCTLSGLSQAWAAGALPPAEGFAVTAGLREWYPEGDEEEIEWAAQTLAARSVLGLITAADPATRVVVTAEVPDSDVGSVDAEGRGSVLLGADVPVARWKAVHVDDPASAPVIARAVAAWPTAQDDEDPGVDDAIAVVDEADDADLLWHTVAEVPQLLP